MRSSCAGHAESPTVGEYHYRQILPRNQCQRRCHSRHATCVLDNVIAVGAVVYKPSDSVTRSRLGVLGCCHPMHLVYRAICQDGLLVGQMVFQGETSPKRTRSCALEYTAEAPRWSKS